MVLVGPTGGSGGYSAKILHFEFAKTYSDIAVLFSSLSPDEFKGLKIVNYIDYGFMVIYSAFLGWFSFRASQHFKFKPLLLGVPLAFTVCLLDGLENWKLLEMMDLWTKNDVSSEAFTNPLFWLGVFTWPKWLGIALILFLIAIPVRHMGKIGMLLAAFLSLILPLGLVALVLSNVVITNLFGIGVIMAITGLVFSCFYLE